MARSVVLFVPYLTHKDNVRACLMADLGTFPNVKPALGFTAVCLIVGIIYSIGSSTVITLIFGLLIIISAVYKVVVLGAIWRGP